MELKIFEINTGGEREWVAAYSNIHALQVLSSFNGMDLHEFGVYDSVQEVVEDEWEHYKIKDEYGRPESNFKEWMASNDKPDFIATTCF